MTIKLTLKKQLTPGTDLCALSPQSVSRYVVERKDPPMIRTGNKTWLLTDCFAIEGQQESDTIEFSGDLSGTCNLGSGLSDGTIIANSSLGDNAGSRMSGGELIVNGNCGCQTGMDMTGGTIRINGDCGTATGAASPGSDCGMRGGTILVSGNCGDQTGRRMRRGLIAVGGNCGMLTGHEMRAGTIIAAGRCERHTGQGMVRGSILCGSVDPDPMTFTHGPSHHPSMIGLLRVHLQRLSFDHADDLLSQLEYSIWNGDRNQGGRGEIFSPNFVSG